MNTDKNTSEQISGLPESLIDEVLKMDRMFYLERIQEKESLTSLQMTREILALKDNIEPKQVKKKDITKNNPNINKRLKDLTDLGILNDHGGKYLLSPIGSLIIHELTALKSNIEVLKEHKRFFNLHDYTVIPYQQFREIYKLQFAKQCKDTIEYHKLIEDNTAKTNQRICIATDRLHDMPNWIIQEMEEGNLSLKLVYQFKKPFKINSDYEEEQKLWEGLTREAFPKTEFRYLALEERNPIGIRIIDDKWAEFNLFEFAENKLNRPRSFYGTHKQFIAWVGDVFSSIWNSSEILEISNLQSLVSKGD